MKRKLLAVLVTVFVFLTVLTVSASATTQNGWVVIDGYYHYFDSYGYEYTGDEYWIEEYDAYFRFDEEGRMLTNQWFWNEDNECWQFYKAGGYRADNEILNIGGYLYAFDDYAMVEGYAEIYDDATEELKYVYATDGGVLYSGWLQDEYGDWYYFLPDGKMARNQVAYVGGYWYAFNWDGQMYTESSDIYDYEAETWRYFRPRSDGTLITGWYLDEYGDWYYYGDNGLAPGYGLTYVGGVP
ncbi:MAG: hypothetical protein IIX54_00040, partial [Clostridia bacterium]|nr:hypothetical protein [Clostridia bacterium]